MGQKGHKDGEFGLEEPRGKTKEKGDVELQEVPISPGPSGWQHDPPEHQHPG